MEGPRRLNRRLGQPVEHALVLGAVHARELEHRATLQKFIYEQLAAETAVSNERRKAREERTLTKPKNKSGAKGEGKDG